MTWKPLNPSMFKINFDGAVFKNDNKSGIGVVIRDHQGLVIASLAQQLSHAFQPLKIEVLVAAQTITFDVETGIGKVVLKRDSELIITALKAGDQTLLWWNLSFRMPLFYLVCIQNCYTLIAKEMAIN